MDFRLLGPLDVRVDDVGIALGGPKPRALLAALLLRRGSVVSVHALSDAVWGEEVPAGAATALRAYVSRLRAALEADDEPRRLEFRTGGYVFAAADAEVDVAGVEAAVAEARRSDPRRAVDLYDLALARWRGEALAEFAGRDFADAEAARLAELRLTVAAERADALLALGRGAELVADLELTVRQFPERERPAVQLMQALYAAGRQSEALGVFHGLRKRLDDELGVEPSEPARTLYLRILDQDPALTPARALPGNLPRRVTSFVGRETELDGLVAAMRDNALVTVVGPGGAGKSRLALQAASRDPREFPGGVWLCELAPLPEGSAIGDALASALRLRQQHGRSIDETVVEYLRTRRLLLIVDNCEHVLAGSAELVDRIVAHCPDVAMLATSRERLGVQGEQLWPLPPLSTEDAAALFVDRARAQRPDFASDPEAVADLCRRLDGLPLAIELAAARTGAMSAKEIATRIADGLPLADSRRGAEQRHRSLDAAIGWSYDLLAPIEKELFAGLSVFAGGFDLEAAHGVCGMPGAPDVDTLTSLADLVERSMVVSDRGAEQTRYRILETLRAYGRERLRATGTEEPVGRRHAEYFADFAARAAQGARGPDERSWIERALPEIDNLRAAFQFAERDGDADLALRVVAPLPEVLHVRHGYESSGWAERCLDLADPAHPLFVAVAGGAARGAWNRGELELARELAGLAGGRSPAPHTARVAYAGDVAADLALFAGGTETALRHYEAELAAARIHGDPIRLVWTLYYVAVCHAVARAPQEGLAAAEESLAVAERTGNPTARSMGQYALGLVQKKSHPDLALARFDEAARLAAEVHNFWWEGIALMEAAATRGVHGDVPAAARAFADVLDHWERVGDWTQQWLNLRYVARLFARADAIAPARALHLALTESGRSSPLAGTAFEVPDAPALSAAQAVALARAHLRVLAG